MAYIGIKCELHEMNSISLWCRECCEGVCVECMETNHTSHSFESFKEYIKQRAALILNKVPVADKKLEEIERKLEQKQETITVLKRKLEECEKQTSEITILKKSLRRIVDMKQSLETVANGGGVVNNEMLSISKSDLILKLNAEKVVFTFDENFADIKSLKEKSWESSCRAYGKFNLRAELRYSFLEGTPWLAAFLGVSPRERGDLNWEIKLRFKLHIINQSGKTFTLPSSKRPNLFNKTNRAFGYDSFMKWDTLLQPNLGWHRHYGIRIRVEILENL